MRHEAPEQAMYRELAEETGLQAEQVAVIGCTKGWLRYKLPSRYMRRGRKPVCIGQKQIWYMLRLLDSDDCVNLRYSPKPEFDSWQWVDYWYPVDQVIYFKRKVYHQALKQLAHLIPA